MTNQRILELLTIERKCIWRNIDKECDRDCSKCDLVQEDSELLELYSTLIIEYRKKARTERIEAR